MFLSGLSLGLNVDHNLPLEAIEFPAEASTSNEEDLWKVYESKKEDKSQPSASYSITPVEKPGKAAKSGKNMKRRATEEEQSDNAAKKPKRAMKVRSGSKRVKT